jgi:hypothetical protein
VQYSYVLETLDGQKLTEGSVNAGCSNEGQQPDPVTPTCTIATTVEANSVNYAVSCTQPGWYNLKFGDGGNTHIESGTNKPHSFSCLDNLVQYSYVLETLDGQKLTEGSVNAGCSNEGQQPQPDLTHKLYCPLITR